MDAFQSIISEILWNIARLVLLFKNNLTEGDNMGINGKGAMGFVIISALLVASMNVLGDGAAGKVFPIVHAVKGAKKIKEKLGAKEAQEEICAKLKERYPEEMKAIEAERESNAGEAKKKTEALIKRYKDDTGVDLNTLKPKEEKEGIIRSRLEKRLNQSNS